jgi:tRNA pseudouridine38-40 synthase
VQRYKLIIEYNGAPFAGWQRQRDAISVQSVLEDTISKLYKQDITLFGAGRTDSGVHALGQVAHFDFDGALDTHKFVKSINYFLRPHPIVILSCDSIHQSFHARFSAISRSYIYKILNRPQPSVIYQGFAWHLQKHLDVQAMHDAAQALVGKHDFSSFRAVHCQSASPVKHINSIAVRRNQDFVEIHLNAPSFLHNQVRIITGCLKMVGEDKWTKEQIEYLLDVKDRTKAAATAPSAGLFFIKAEY